jgi:glycosyltransferase involved in cell wall biosynthesis
LSSQLNPTIKQVELNRKGKFDLRALRLTAAMVRESQVVHVHARYVLRFVLLATLFLKKRIVFLDHNGLNYQPDRFISLMRRKIIYVGVSVQLRNYAMNILGFAAGDAHAISNIIIQERRATNTVRTPNSLVMVSNFYPDKNVEFALDVLERVRGHRAVRLDIYGNPLVPEYADRIRDRVAAMPTGSVQVISNTTDTRERLERYSLAIHTSRLESGPLVLLEYLGNGIPFLAFKTGEVAHNLADKIPAYFMDNFDTDAWAKRVNLLLDSNPYSADAIKDLFDNYCNSDLYITKWEEIYKRAEGY